MTAVDSECNGSAFVTTTTWSSHWKPITACYRFVRLMWVSDGKRWRQLAMKVSADTLATIFERSLVAGRGRLRPLRYIPLGRLVGGRASEIFKCILIVMWPLHSSIAFKWCAEKEFWIVATPISKATDHLEASWFSKRCKRFKNNNVISSLPGSLVVVGQRLLVGGYARYEVSLDSNSVEEGKRLLVTNSAMSYTITNTIMVNKTGAHIVTVHRTLPNIYGKTAGLNSRVATGQSAKRNRNYTVV